jgi:hypothetical protein
MRRNPHELRAQAFDLKAEAFDRQAAAARLLAEAERLELDAPRVARDVYTTARNCAALHGGKKWRAIDEWARRLGLERLQLAGSPAYRTADVDAAIAGTGKRNETGSNSAAQIAPSSRLTAKDFYDAAARSA